jgi:hypothetical protein
MPHQPLDPDRTRNEVLEALHDMPSPLELEALHAVERGEVDLEDRPIDDELVVRVGEITVTVDRHRCVADPTED